jgi:mannose-6-phosphate isomerase-like protein (cupin superfamily)
LGFAALFALSHAISFAQAHSKPTVATDITDEQVKEVLKHAPHGVGQQLVDQQLKVVDVGPYNVAVGVVHLGPTKDPNDGTAPCIQHHRATETYIIVSGGGTLVTGGTIENAEEEPKTSETYTTLAGPTADGRVRTSEAQVRRVKPGDIVIIPPDVCHGWMDYVDYLSVRPDPNHLLPAGYVNPAIRK